MSASSRWAALQGFLGRHAYLALAAGALLVLTRTVDFSPPPQVRPDPMKHGGAAGTVPVQAFSPGLRDPEVVQLRAVLRRYDDAGLPVSGTSRELDERGAVLSSPLMTAVVGTEAAVDQRVRLEGGDLELELGLRATPRAAAGGIQLEHELTVRSRRTRWSGPEQRLVLDAHGVLGDAEARWVFTVDGHLFSLDLELVRPGGAV